MSELIDNAERKKGLLKHMIRQLHDGQAPAQVRTQLARLLGQVPYGDVVEVEEQLIQEGLPTEEILRLCDVHAEALQGLVQIRSKPKAPPGHPAHTFAKENAALDWEVKKLGGLFDELAALPDAAAAGEPMAAVRSHFNALMDVEKHYRRKENLLFPFLERHAITGPPKVMWGKHDETRALLKGAMETLAAAATLTAAEARGVVDLVLRPAATAVGDMIYKEEQILLPMCLDTLTDAEWYEIARQSAEIGFCLVDPTETWKPDGVAAEPDTASAAVGRIQLPSGSLTPQELTAVLNTIPFDLTFVDKDDTVRYFTQGRERIFSRSRAIIGRKVQFCHPPSSVKIVDQILSDFRDRKHDQAAFWINMKGRFIHIEYFAVRGSAGEYLGCLEVSQDLTAKRALSGEQRLLSYQEEKTTDAN
ncbi:MAG: DUF438 domain-containing protein [Deltaproteobacteria bacterium]|nr:DUF438 domain-containing protein [Deltaproteobacteria bacterium]